MAKQNVKFEIVHHIGVISRRKSYQKEVNLVSWNDAPPVLDIRNFRISKDGKKTAMKGITLEKEDVTALQSILSALYGEVER